MSVFDNTLENRCRPRVQGVTDGGHIAERWRAFFRPVRFNNDGETAEELSRQPDVRKELVRTTGQKRTEESKQTQR